MAGPSIVGKYFGNAASETAAFAAGAAIGPTLSPILQALRNETWAQYPDVPIEALYLAAGVAQGQVTEAYAVGEAAKSGISADTFAHLVNIANAGPPLGQAMELLRRGVWTPAQYTTALNRQGIEEQWFAGLLALKLDILSPDDLARAIHKSLIPDPGLLAVPQPTGTGKVPAYPVYDIDALAEALGSGFDKDRLGVLVGLQGNPMGAHEAAQAQFRGILDPVDYDRAIAEGNTRNEWGGAIREQSRQIPTSHEFIEGRLRGWIDDAAMYAGTGKHGMTQADTDLLFEVSGRPLSWHQVWIGLQRGGTYDGPTNEIDPAFLNALKQSNVRPEYYNLAWAQRYNYPSAFVLRSLAQTGEITEAKTEQVLLYEGWEPGFAKQVATTWATGGSGGAKDATAANLRAEYEGLFITRAQLVAGLTNLGYSATEADMLADLGDAARVKKYRDTYVTSVYKAFLAHEIDTVAAHTDLLAAGIDAAAIENMIRYWNLELAVARKQLSPAQIAAGYRRQTITLATALGDLEDAGYTPEDSQTLLGLALPVLTVSQIQKGLGSTVTYEQAVASLTEQGYTPEQILELIGPNTPPTPTAP